MSGHSKWSTIKRRKGAIDAKRGKIFTKLIREITVAARTGGEDPDSNPRLRSALQTARSNNMPTATIDRAIRKGMGDEAGVTYDEIAYEGYGPGGVAFLIDTLTDNRNRTTSEVRHLLTKAGGSMGDPGSVAWLFELRGLIAVEKGDQDEDEIMMVALDAGAEDISDEGDVWEINTLPTDLAQVADALREGGITPGRVEFIRVAKTTVEVGRDVAGKVIRLAENLEDLDDVQRVSANFEIPEDILHELSSTE